MNIIEYLFSSLVLLLCCRICLTLQLPVIQRKLLNKGFHRDLSTILDIPLTDFTETDIRCFSICKEFLPSNVYVDKFQLNTVSKHLGLQYKSPVLDIEKPEYQSESFTVTIYSQVHISTDSALINVTLPIHIRYHQQETDYRNFTIRNPDIYIYCDKSYYKGESSREEQLPCNFNDGLLCNWKLLKYKSNVNSLEVIVPVGNDGHTMVVVIGTLMVTFGSCLWIIKRTISGKIKNQ